jgi:hypothetical protein
MVLVPADAPTWPKVPIGGPDGASDQQGLFVDTDDDSSGYRTSAGLDRGLAADRDPSRGEDLEAVS